MNSIALRNWQEQRCGALDEMEEAHAMVGGTARGRRFATQQINRGYAVLLASHFQGYCRDLHSESADILAHHWLGPNLYLSRLLRAALTRERKLDRGNAHEGTIANDYNRFGLNLWSLVDRQDARNVRRREHLRSMNLWRNAISHQDFNAARLGGKTTLRLADVRQWRSSCNRLATCLDKAMQQHLQQLTGVAPW